MKAFRNFIVTLDEHHFVSNRRELDSLFNSLSRLKTNEPHQLNVTYPLWLESHYSHVIMGVMASQSTGVPFFCSGGDQRKHVSSVSLAFVRGIHRWPVDSPHKGPVTRKMFPWLLICNYAIKESLTETELKKKEILPTSIRHQFGRGILCHDSRM